MVLSTVGLWNCRKLCLVTRWGVGLGVGCVGIYVPDVGQNDSLYPTPCAPCQAQKYGMGWIRRGVADIQAGLFSDVAERNVTQSLSERGFAHRDAVEVGLRGRGFFQLNLRPTLDEYCGS